MEFLAFVSVTSQLPLNPAILLFLPLGSAVSCGHGWGILHDCLIKYPSLVSLGSLLLADLLTC